VLFNPQTKKFNIISDLRKVLEPMGWQYTPEDGLSNIYGRAQCKQVIDKKELAEIRKDLKFIIDSTNQIFKEQGALAGLNTPIKQSDVPRLALSM